jgi:hypothetical protein
MAWGPVRAGAAVIVILLASGAAHAAEADDVASLKREVEALKAEVGALKEALAALQAQTASQASAAAPAAPPSPAPEAPAPTGAAAFPYPAANAPARSQNLMNPAISAVFQFIGNTFTDRQDANGFDLSEAEVALESVVDPYAKMNLYLTFPAEGSPDVEEGYVSTLSLPASLQLKGGRFKEALGKWNTLHTHAFPTVDQPDVLTNLLGPESLTNDGLSLSWLIPNPKGLYLESITEVGTARENVAFNSEERALTYGEHLSAFFNTTANSTIETGVSAFLGQTGPTEALIGAIGAAGLTGTLQPDPRLDSEVDGIDVTWKWKPLQQNTYHSFLMQTEALQTRRQVQTLQGAALVDDNVRSTGGYFYVEDQWVKRWRAGARFDMTGFPDSTTDRLWSATGVVKFQPSEFQELRFEVKHTRRNPGAAARLDTDQDDTQFFFEWIPIIGAHGAHKY